MKTKIYFATKNKGKINSAKATLSEYNIEVIHTPLDLPEPRTDDIQKIAREKVLFAYNQIKKPCIALDAGFYIYSLAGFPKTFVNFALETIDIEGILKLVEDKPRDCEFRNCLAYFDDLLAEPVYFESNVEGILSPAPRGEMKDYFWSKLFLIFIPKDASKTLAEMTLEEYQAWRSNRYPHSFLIQFAKWLSRR